MGQSVLGVNVIKDHLHQRLQVCFDAVELLVGTGIRVVVISVHKPFRHSCKCRNRRFARGTLSVHCPRLSPYVMSDLEMVYIQHGTVQDSHI